MVVGTARSSVYGTATEVVREGLRFLEARMTPALNCAPLRMNSP